MFKRLIIGYKLKKLGYIKTWEGDFHKAKYGYNGGAILIYKNTFEISATDKRRKWVRNELKKLEGII